MTLAMQQPWQNLLLFDGVCGLCQRGVQSILLNDPAGVIQFCSIQSDLGTRLYREQGLDPEVPSTMVLLTPEGAFTESDALIEIGSLLGGWRRSMSLFKCVPKSVRDWAYQLIARNRYRWFGKNDQCMMPQPEWRDRFLN